MRMVYGKLQALTNLINFAFISHDKHGNVRSKGSLKMRLDVSVFIHTPPLQTQPGIVWITSDLGYLQNNHQRQNRAMRAGRLHRPAAETCTLYVAGCVEILLNATKYTKTCCNADV